MCKFIIDNELTHLPESFGNLTISGNLYLSDNYILKYIVDELNSLGVIPLPIYASLELVLVNINPLLPEIIQLCKIIEKSNAEVEFIFGNFIL